MLKAIEHGQEIDPEAFSSKGKGRRTIKMALLGKLQSGIILFLVGTGMPSGTVRSHLSRGRAHLKKYLRKASSERKDKEGNI